MPPPLPGTVNTETVVRQAQEEEAAARAQRQAQEEEAAARAQRQAQEEEATARAQRQAQEEEATARAQRQAQEEEAENARRAAEEQASANRAEEEEAASARRAKAEREAEEAKRQEAERRAFSLKVAQEEAIKNSKNNTDKEEAYQNLHECSVIEGFCEIEFKKYTKNGDPRFKDRACADCSVVISTTSAYACKNFWMAEISDPSMCHRPFLCCSCFEAENEYKSGKRKRRKRSLD